jgi:1-deoxy-D-xylulose-5-phosphate reductoisomerase
MAVKNVALLGASGSVGRSALNVLRRNREEFHLIAISVHRNLAVAEKILEEFAPRYLALSGLPESSFPNHCSAQPISICELAAADSVDCVIVALPGLSALRPLLAAITAGKHIVLANKESLISAGAIVRDAMARSSATLLPADSEHCGIFQCLSCESGFRGVFCRPDGVRRVWLTASGGPFWDWSAVEFANATPAAALRHPHWAMGKKISVDSATLANKGLEEIEAGWLYDLRPEEIGVLVHRQCLLHGLVEFCDGSLLAQLSPTSMEYPIAYGLHYPRRQSAAAQPPLDLAAAGTLNFCPPDRDKFPCLALAEEAFRLGKSAPCDFDAANGAAVEAFLREEISFGAIPSITEQTLSSFSPLDLSCASAVEARHEEVYRAAEKLCLAS